MTFRFKDKEDCDGPAAQEDGTREGVAVLGPDDSLELYEAYAGAEEIDGLDRD